MISRQGLKRQRNYTLLPSRKQRLHTCNLLPGLRLPVLAPNNFIFQQDGAPAHTSRLAQEWLATEQNTPDFIEHEWPPNSPDSNPLDFHIWGLYAGEISSLHTEADKQDRTDNRAGSHLERLATRASIKKAVLAFRKRLQACIRANGGHLENRLP